MPQMLPARVEQIGKFRGQTAQLDAGTFRPQANQEFLQYPGPGRIQPFYPRAIEQ